jgi:hypothetical protein
LKILFTFVAKQAALMRRSTALSLSLQLVFPGISILFSGFLVTNMPRILLDLHELVVFENALACGKAGYQ